MSTCVSDIQYDQETRTLTVAFVKGGTFSYQDVPPHVVKAFKAAGSLGQFFNANIKHNY